MPVSSPTSGYGLNAILELDGEMARSQTDIRYEWTVNSASGQSPVISLTEDSFTTARNDGGGTLTFINYSLLAFPKRSLPDPSPEGYILEVVHGPVIVSTDPMTGYGVNTRLYLRDGTPVTDQKNFRYEWTVANPAIANVVAGAACIYGITEPCPAIHADVRGLTVGKTTSTVRAIDTSSQSEVAQATFPIQVTKPVANCVMQGSAVMVMDTTKMCCSGLTLVPPTDDNIGIAGFAINFPRPVQ